jgi:hypothetical protein
MAMDENGPPRSMTPAPATREILPPWLREHDEQLRRDRATQELALRLGESGGAIPEIVSEHA